MRIDLGVLFLFLVFVLEKPGKQQRTGIGPGRRAMASEGPTSILNILPSIWHLEKTTQHKVRPVAMWEVKV